MKRLFLLSFLTPMLLALAQSPTGTLVGRVLDATGAAVSQAAILARNADNNETRTARTTATGEFTIPNLPPGVYTVSAEKNGFRRIEEQGLELQIDQTLRLDLKLEVGMLQQAVEVIAAIPPLNTENGSKGDVIVTQEIAYMPLDGRDFSDLANLVAGVLPNAQGGQGSAFAVNGARGDNTNFAVDGFETRDPRNAYPQNRPPLDALQEFKMLVSGYSAESGRLAGGLMSMVLKSGGNRAHGSLFEYVRNDLFDARNFFDQDKHKLRRNQFGATLTGPVFIPRLYNGRDRTFFVLSWESYRQSQGSAQLGRVPTFLERQGDFSRTLDASGSPELLHDPLASGACTAKDHSACFPGNVIPASRFSPVALKILGYMPKPNLPDGANNFLATASDTDGWDAFLYKIDRRFSDADNLSVRFLQRFIRNMNPFAGSNPGNFPVVSDDREELLGFTYTHVVNPSMVNETRAGISRSATYRAAPYAGRDLGADVGLPPEYTDPSAAGFPSVTIRNFFKLGEAATTPSRLVANNLNGADTLTWVKGRHLVKVGGDVLRMQMFQYSPNNPRGSYRFLGRWTNDTMGDFLLGLLNDSSRESGLSPAYFFATSYGLFVQDDFKLRPDLTLNIGLRYEIPKPPIEKYGRLSSYVPELRKVIMASGLMVPGLAQRLAAANLQGKVDLARNVGLPASLAFTNYHNMAPRFGLAWRPAGSRGFVVRGGYGIFFGGSSLLSLRDDFSYIYPFVTAESYSRVTTNPNALTLADPFPAALSTIGNSVLNVSGFDIHAPTPYLQSWNATVEREVGRSTAVEAGYSGSKGTHLGRVYAYNQPYSTPGYPKPVPEFNAISMYGSGSNSNYNAGMVTLRRRFASGVFYRASYIYSKSIDDSSQTSGSSDGGYASAQDPRNLSLERARSDWDVGHTFQMSFTWQTPQSLNRLLRSWHLSGTGRMYTGQPFTPQLSNAATAANEPNRPDRIADGAVDNPGPLRWFDINAFRQVAVGSYRVGTSGRNILDGPGQMSVNLGLSKDFKLREVDHVQFRWEVFNATNRVNFRQPVKTIDSPNAATITAAGDSRSMQFALRYQF